MTYWTGEIVFKSDWEVHSTRQMPTIVYDWEAHEIQTWTLNGPPTADIYDPTANIYDVTWAITGSGNDSDDYPDSQEKWTSDWTINGSNNSGLNHWPIKIRIKELSNYIWRVESTANGKNCLECIDMKDTYTAPGKNTPTILKLNRHELNIPRIAVEKSAYIIARLTGGKTGVVTGPSGFQRWSLLQESLRNSLTGWIIHEIPVPSNDVASYGVRDLRAGSKLKPPCMSTLTGACTWS